MERLQSLIASLLPRWLVKWALVRALHEVGEIYSGVEFDSLTLPQLIELLEGSDAAR